MKLKYREYSKIRDSIREGDLLLIRGDGKPSPFIRYYTRSQYTHIMVASWTFTPQPDGSFKQDILESIEFREGYGSRTTNLSEYVIRKNTLIDVYRPADRVKIFDEDHPDGYWKEFNPYQLTRQMRRATGKPYGWKTIGKLWAAGTPLRICMPFIYDDELEGDHNVCSSSLSYYLRKDYVDFVKNLADDYTRPGDFARSPLTHYMYTLVK